MRAVLRRPAATGAVGVLILAGSLAGAGSAPAAGATLAYTCQFPTGPEPVEVTVAATLPQRGSVGEPIAPDAVSVNLALPPAALAGLTGLGASSVAGKLTLSVRLSQNDESATAEWSGLDLPSTPFPPEGGLAVTAAGPVPTVTVAQPGDITVAAGDLGMELIPATADGAATDPATWSVPCALNPDQDPTLATVAVPRSSEPPSTHPLPSSAAPPSARTGGPDGGITVGPNPEATAPETRAAANPPECGQITPLPTQEQQTNCAFVPGRSNVKKLNASVVVEAVLTNVALGRGRSVPPPPGSPPGTPATQIQDSLAELAVPKGSFHPVTGSFVAFGFAPVAATLDLSTVPLDSGNFIEIHGESQGSGLPCQPGQPPGGTPRCTKYFIRTTAKLAARVRDVRINGVPLDVGENCRTERPLDVTVQGGTPEFVNVRFGGPLFGFVEIPPFTGCGETEDLSPLLTGTVSGPGNFIKVIQGALCNPRPNVPPTQTACPPPMPANPLPQPQ